MWHGWHAGYYVTFFNEFIVISFEKDFSTVWNKSVRVARYQSSNANMGQRTCAPDINFSGGRSIQLTPLSPPSLAGKTLLICSLSSQADQVLCYLLPTALLPRLSTSWVESLLASLPGQLSTEQPFGVRVLWALSSQLPMYSNIRNWRHPFIINYRVSTSSSTSSSWATLHGASWLGHGFCRTTPRGRKVLLMLWKRSDTFEEMKDTMSNT